MTDYPHVPAAFINAIREEGTKEEACDYLQKQWNECCALLEQLANARREERERCVNVARTYGGDAGSDIADIINALDDEK